MIPCKLKLYVACLPWHVLHWGERHRGCSLAAAARSFPENKKKSQLLKGQLQITAHFVQRACEHFYSLFISLSWVSSSTVTYSAWKHRLSLVLQTQRCWFKGLSWQSLLPGVDLLISRMQGKRVELHNAVMQGEIPWWAFTSGLTLLLPCFKYRAFKEITPHFHWCKWGSDNIFCISISRYTNWKALCVRWGDTVEESCFFCVFSVCMYFPWMLLREWAGWDQSGVIHSLHLPFSMECGLVHVKGQSQLSL